MNRSVFRFLAVAGAAGLAACSADSTAPSAADKVVNADVALATTQSVATDLNVNGGLTAGAMGTGAFLSTDAPLGVAFDVGPASGSGAPMPPMGCNIMAGPFARYDCGRSEHRGDARFGNRVYHRTVTYYNAADSVQAGFDPATTKKIVFVTSDTGNFTRAKGQDTLTDSSARARTATLVRIPGADTIHTWNAIGSANHFWSRVGPNGTRSYKMVATDSTIDLKYRLPRALNPYPISGQIIRNVAVVRTRTPKDSTTTTVEKTRRVVITFDGTSTAQMTVNGEAFTIDLSKGDADEGRKRP